MMPQGSTPVCHTIKPRRTAHHAMTLIELLIVLGIISVLAAILLPVFSRIRDHSRRTVCISNIHQAAIAVTMFQQDNDTIFPSYPDPHDSIDEMQSKYAYNVQFGFCKGTLDNTPVWTDNVLPYLAHPVGTSSVTVTNETSPTVLYCPVDSAPRRSAAVTDPANHPERHPSSYEFKFWLAKGHLESEIRFPSLMAMLWEQSDYHQGGQHNEFSRDMAGFVAMVDGHIKWVRFSETTRALAGNTPDLGAFAGNEANPQDDDGADIR